MAGNDGCSDCNAEKNHSLTASAAKRKCRTRRVLAVVCVVIVVICGLLALPTIVYHLPEDSNPDNAVTDACTPQRYTGSVCREALQTRQNCLPDRNNTYDVIIAADSASSQFIKDKQVCLFLGRFNLVATSPECMQAVVASLCLNTYPLCDSSSHPYYLSSAECRAITDGICAEDLREMQLPNCQSLSETSLECNISAELGETTMSNPEESINSIFRHCTSTPRCNEGFYNSENTGLCTPECGVWEEFPHSTVVGIDATVIVSAVVYLVTGAVMLVISCINYKKMLVFPSIFIVYSVIALGVMEVFLLTGFSNRTSLLCSSKSLLSTIENETLFCSIQGLVFCYALLVLELFWLFHILTIFWRMKFPFHAKSIEMKGYFRYIHVVMLLTVIALPWISLGIMLRTGGFTMLNFPPRVCLPRSTDTVFYSFLLPISVINAIGIPLIIVILSILIITMGKFQQQSKENEQTTMNAAKIKLLIIFVYFSITSIFSLVAYTVVAKQSTDFRTKLAVYFRCEAQGIQPDRACEKEFGRFNGDVLVALIYLLLGLYPAVNLVYVVNVKEMKRKCAAWFSNSRQQ